MTVGELIAELQKQPAHLKVQIVYDSAVCSEDIELVAQWFPDAYMTENGRGRNCIGLFDKSSTIDMHDLEDERWPRRPATSGNK